MESVKVFFFEICLFFSSSNYNNVFLGGVLKIQNA